jgi:hypothetical protein
MVTFLSTRPEELSAPLEDDDAAQLQEQSPLLGSKTAIETTNFKWKPPQGFLWIEIGICAL